MKKVVGQHIIVDVSGISSLLLKDLDFLEKAILNALHNEGFSILGTKSHKFKTGGEGVTLVVLLSESHAAIHTYPEYEYMSLDIYSCGQQSPKRVVAALVKHFRGCWTKEIMLQRIVGGNSIIKNDSYENLVFIGLENYNSGDLDSSTIFVFKQKSKAIWGEYFSDNITGGVFQGGIGKSEVIQTCWQHLNSDCQLVQGIATITPEKSLGNKIILSEEWTITNVSPNVSGKSKLIQLKSSENRSYEHVG